VVAVKQNTHLKYEEFWIQNGKGAVTRKGTAKEAKDVLAYVRKNLPVQEIDLCLDPFSPVKLEADDVLLTSVSDREKLHVGYTVEETADGYSKETLVADNANIVFFRKNGEVVSGYYEPKHT